MFYFYLFKASQWIVLIHFNTELQITTVHCLEGDVIPNLIHSHTVSRVPGLTASCNALRITGLPR